MENTVNQDNISNITSQNLNEEPNSSEIEESFLENELENTEAIPDSIAEIADNLMASSSLEGIDEDMQEIILDTDNIADFENARQKASEMAALLAEAKKTASHANAEAIKAEAAYQAIEFLPEKLLAEEEDAKVVADLAMALVEDAQSAKNMADEEYTQLLFHAESGLMETVNNALSILAEKHNARIAAEDERANLNVQKAKTSMIAEQASVNTLKAQSMRIAAENDMLLKAAEAELTLANHLSKQSRQATEEAKRSLREAEINQTASIEMLKRLQADEDAYRQESKIYLERLKTEGGVAIKTAEEKSTLAKAEEENRHMMVLDATNEVDKAKADLASCINKLNKLIADEESAQINMQAEVEKITAQALDRQNTIGAKASGFAAAARAAKQTAEETARKAIEAKEATKPAEEALAERTAALEQAHLTAQEANRMAERATTARMSVKEESSDLLAQAEKILLATADNAKKLIEKRQLEYDTAKNELDRLKLNEEVARSTAEEAARIAEETQRSKLAADEEYEKACAESKQLVNIAKGKMEKILADFAAAKQEAEKEVEKATSIKDNLTIILEEKDSAYHKATTIHNSCIEELENITKEVQDNIERASKEAEDKLTALVNLRKEAEQKKAEAIAIREQKALSWEKSQKTVKKADNAKLIASKKLAAIVTKSELKLKAAEESINDFMVKEEAARLAYEDAVAAQENLQELRRAKNDKQTLESYIESNTEEQPQPEQIPDNTVIDDGDESPVLDTAATVPSKESQGKNTLAKEETTNTIDGINQTSPDVKEETAEITFSPAFTYEEISPSMASVQEPLSANTETVSEESNDSPQETSISNTGNTEKDLTEKVIEESLSTNDEPDHQPEEIEIEEIILEDITETTGEETQEEPESQNLADDNSPAEEFGTIPEQEEEPVEEIILDEEEQPASYQISFSEKSYEAEMETLLAAAEAAIRKADEEALVAIKAMQEFQSQMESTINETNIDTAKPETGEDQITSSQQQAEDNIAQADESKDETNNQTEEKHASKRSLGSKLSRLFGKKTPASPPIIDPASIDVSDTPLPETEEISVDAELTEGINTEDAISTETIGTIATTTITIPEPETVPEDTEDLSQIIEDSPVQESTLTIPAIDDEETLIANVLSPENTAQPSFKEEKIFDDEEEEELTRQTEVRANEKRAAEEEAALRKAIFSSIKK